MSYQERDIDLSLPLLVCDLLELINQPDHSGRRSAFLALQNHKRSGLCPNRLSSGVEASNRLLPQRAEYQFLGFLDFLKVERSPRHCAPFFPVGQFSHCKLSQNEASWLAHLFCDFDLRTMPPFPYRQIAGDEEIRLVELQPLRDGSDTVQLSLIHANLAEHPKYTAVSYTWGAPFHGLPPSWDASHPTHSVMVNELEFLVHQNLDALLRQFAQDLDEPRRFWIDAICIN